MALIQRNPIFISNISSWIGGWKRAAATKKFCFFVFFNIISSFMWSKRNFQFKCSLMNWPHYPVTWKTACFMVDLDVYWNTCIKIYSNTFGEWKSKRWKLSLEYELYICLSRLLVKKMCAPTSLSVCVCICLIVYVYVSQYPDIVI